MNDWLKDDEEDCWGDDGLLKIRVTREKKKLSWQMMLSNSTWILTGAMWWKALEVGPGGAEALRVKACGGGGS